MTQTLLDEFPPDRAGHPMRDIPIVAHMGLELLLAERGRCVLRLPFAPNVNHVGMIYAGSLFTAAEVPGGVLFAGAFDLTRFYPIVGDMQIRFSKPAMSSVLVDARMSEAEIERVTAELEEHGKAKWVLDQELVDERGRPVAATSATYFGMSFPG